MARRWRSPAPCTGGLVLVVDMKDLPPGERAVHIHALGDCSSPDGKSAGDHFNPERSRWIKSQPAGNSGPRIGCGVIEAVTRK